jgi:glycosyltransferase involved in cell wall biosynthesis
MRALHISSGKLYGGVEAVLLTLARCGGLFPELEQEFAVCFEGRLSEELRVAGARVHMLGQVRARSPLSVLAAQRLLRKLLPQESFDIVICHMAWPQAVFGPVVRSAHVPLVLWHHDPSDGRHWVDRWAKFSPPDFAICNSRFTAGKLGKIYPLIRREVLYCPVHFREHGSPDGIAAKRAAVRKDLNLLEDEIAILQVGRMEPHKGHLQHLEALGQLRGVPGWVCWQVGEAQRPLEARYLESLKVAASRLGISERIRFLGYWPDLPSLMSAADIYCQPNIGPEGFGITLVEALHAGLPVITSALGPATEIIDESCGILVPPGDTSALSVALRKLIDDPKPRRQLGAVGPERSNALCDPPAQVRKLHTLLAQAAESFAGGTVSDAGAA